MLREDLTNIFELAELTYLNAEGNELPFVDVFEQIYFNWDKNKLQAFMNAILAIEVNGGGNPFERK